jgi:hypothetical protein
MIKNKGTEEFVSAIAEFPNGAVREAFLRQVRLLNGVTGLPRVHAEASRDGVRVQVRTVASARRGIGRLIEAYEGRVHAEMHSPVANDGSFRNHLDGAAVSR